MTTVGPWDIGRPLGRGAQGRVWACRHRETGRPAALKVFVAGGRRAEAWRDEARAIAGLHHPGVVRVHDIGQLQPATADALRVPRDRPWMVMDRAEASLHERAPRTTHAVLAAADQALAALANVHARDILHLDLKPANLLHVEGRVCVADFGMAQWVRERRRHRQVSGTPLFMARVRGRPPPRWRPWRVAPTPPASRSRPSPWQHSTSIRTRSPWRPPG